MNGLDPIAKMFFWIGLLFILMGAFIWLLGRASGFGHLPGDIVWRRGNLTVYVPLASMILLSLILTLILNLISRFWK